MITRIVKLTIDPDRVGEFLSNFNLVKNQIRSFSGCHHLELLQDCDVPGILFTYSSWDTIEDFERYRNSELFISTWKAVKPLFSAKAEAWSLNRIAHVTFSS